jgi:hypothetical protein
MALTEQEFTNFFETIKKGTYACPFCGGVRFSFGVNYEGTPATVTTPMHVSTGEQPGFHAYQTLVCDTCGRTDFFHVRMLDAWKAKNAEGKK